MLEILLRAAGCIPAACRIISNLQLPYCRFYADFFFFTILALTLIWLIKSGPAHEATSYPVLAFIKVIYNT